MKSGVRVALVMGSDSDWKVMKRAADRLEEFGVKSVARVVSAHRTPEDLGPFSSEMLAEGVEVIVAGAGGAAHLPGMIASYTRLPVVGVPIAATKLEGLDALLAVAQMPEGIPVATLAIDGAGNAALFALRILALRDPELAERLDRFREKMAGDSRKKTANLK